MRVVQTLFPRFLPDSREAPGAWSGRRRRPCSGGRTYPNPAALACAAEDFGELFGVDVREGAEGRVEATVVSEAVGVAVQEVPAEGRWDAWIWAGAVAGVVLAGRPAIGYAVNARWRGSG